MEAGGIFAVCLAVTIAMQLFCFLIAYSMRFDKITDLAGSSNFIVLAVVSLYLAPQPPTTRAIVATLLVCLARFELAAFLLWRVLIRGKDNRFDAIRDNCMYFLLFWVWQIIWVYAVCVTVIFINAESYRVRGVPLGGADYIGWALFLLGFVLQVRVQGCPSLQTRAVSQSIPALAA